MVEQNRYLPNSIRMRTVGMLIDDLSAAVIANPEFARQPIGFSVDGELAHIVNGYDECTNKNRIVLRSVQS